MSEDVSSHSSKAGKRWLHVVARILVAVLMVITLFGFLLNVVALAGIWTVYAPAQRCDRCRIDDDTRNYCRGHLANAREYPGATRTANRHRGDRCGGDTRWSHT